MKNILTFEKYNESFLGFGNSNKKINEYIEQLNKLKFTDSTLTFNMANTAIDSLVKFNNIFDKLLDEKFIKNEKEKFLKIKKNIESNPHGINRSTKENKPNYDNIFLGGVHGLFTKDINFWLYKNDEEDILDIVGEQLNNWINNNLDATIKILKKLIE